MRDIAFFLVWIVLFPISLWSAHIGVLLWIWTALISPGDLLYGFMSSIPYNKIIAITTFGVILLNQEKKMFYFDGTLALLLMLAAVSTASALMPAAPSYDSWAIYEKLLKILVLAVVVSGVMWTRYRLHAALLAICLAFGFDGMNDGLKYLVSGGGHKIVGKPALGDNNHLALAVLMTIPLLFYAFKYSTWRIAKYCFLAVIGGCVVTVIGSLSRGGAIGLVVIALMFLKNSKQKAVSFALIGLGGIAILGLAPESWFTRVDSINTVGEDNSFQGRVIAWKISTLIALDRPFTGGGFHAVQLYDVWNRYAENFSLLDFIHTDPAGSSPRAAHSIYFEVLGDIGFLGLSVFLSLIAMGFRNAMLLKRYARQDPRQQWAGDLGSMIQISLVVYCTSGGAVSMGYFETFYVLLVILSRARRTVEEAMAEPILPPPAVKAERKPETRQGRTGAGQVRQPELTTLGRFSSSGRGNVQQSGRSP